MTITFIINHILIMYILYVLHVKPTCKQCLGEVSTEFRREHLTIVTLFDITVVVS